MSGDLRCPHCDGQMAKGSIPDYGHGISEAHWEKGDPDKRTVLGLDVGVKVKEELLIEPCVANDRARRRR